MWYSIHGNFHRVARITGPTHNLLGLSFSESAPEAVSVERLGDSPARAIDEDLLKRAILSAVDEANATLKTDYHVRRIQYVPADTPEPRIYAFLARQIVERLASGGRYEGE